jgi:hypothetical protein
MHHQLMFLTTDKVWLFPRVPAKNRRGKTPRQEEEAETPLLNLNKEL